ncbi:methyltransferase [Actinomadura rubrobrunea]|uniref:Methyltransferase n=1 Tax=Actinomadura rubrobrunea TaxID=115335 RepID=A0A9W6UX27_9ACTN|nr:class I SAM-dependent methyltransferase [Actinomadura rubrobrunea]GLW65673.1 methyltransferase [Actinomadura rubrobrunea]
MDIEAFRALSTAAGRAVLAAAAEADLDENALVRTVAHLRERYPVELVATAVTQARLRVRARAKFGPDADRMYFTPDGLEQSTRARVAAHRARRFTAHLGDGTVLDMGCGIGADLIARARAGCRGEGVERDPLTAAVARANIEAFGVADLASVREGDATREDPARYAAVFADPGRRTGRGRVFDPRSYEPPLGTVMELAARAPAACIKVAPGIPHELIPDGAEAEWVSVGGDVKEAALWLGGLAEQGAPNGAPGARRRATVIASDAPDAPAATLTEDPDLDAPDVRAWGRYLYEPDGAVIRAHLVAEVAALVGGGLADPRIAYVTADAAVATPFAACYEIEDVLPFSVKRLRAELRRRDVGILTIKKRGSAVDVDRLRRDLGYGGGAKRAGAALTVVLTRVGRAPVALLARPVPAERR